MRPASAPAHVACIMDGNRRWAEQNGLPETAGHRAGRSAALDVIDAARSAGVRWLTLFAFSSENWRRPGEEVAFLMQLVQHTVRRHALALHAKDIRCRFLGAADARIPAALRRDIADLENLTRDNRGMTLTAAFGHGGRGDLISAARSLIRAGVPADAVTEELFAAHLPLPDTPDVDLVVRTSGEQRISNFMLWQVAYAEWVYPPELWPDFGTEQFLRCLDTYSRRQRRFGARPQNPAHHTDGSEPCLTRL
ncbi:di-trans,poly-cis-decaprenylcistransferase [Actinospica sp. MGRD01-02]|uniref:Isoprenyl transferase n=1 Tax=Actinospica acidithermotolerans TaxID=2828514 RepID=A0A941IHC6_9ACTN|nr:polyprenyl diphosphate synthase [Actinospica acidithermotolerans]MBR7827069.1 di-trans,poly-cis-decaprenylcistransferase [Actinospica acidithermotolerans]